MAGELADIDEGGTSHELLGDKGVPKVVDFGVFDTGEYEEAVDATSDISNEKGIAGFGDEDVFGTTLGALS